MKSQGTMDGSVLALTIFASVYAVGINVILFLGTVFSSLGDGCGYQSVLGMAVLCLIAHLPTGLLSWYPVRKLGGWLKKPFIAIYGGLGLSMLLVVCPRLLQSIVRELFF